MAVQQSQATGSQQEALSRSGHHREGRLDHAALEGDDLPEARKPPLSSQGVTTEE